MFAKNCEYGSSLEINESHLSDIILPEKKVEEFLKHNARKHSVTSYFGGANIASKFNKFPQIQLTVFSQLN